MTPAELIALAERLEGAEEGSRALDGDLVLLLNIDLNPRKRWAEVGYKRTQKSDCPGTFTYWFAGQPIGERHAPKMTTDMNAAISLIERELPGWGYRFGTCCVSDDVGLFPDYNCPEHGRRLERQYGEPVKGSWQDVGIDLDIRPPGGLKRLPVLICAALCRAKAAEMEG